MAGVEAVSALTLLLGSSIRGAQWLRDIRDCPSAVIELATELSSFEQALEKLRGTASRSPAIEEQLVMVKPVMQDIAKLVGRYGHDNPQNRVKLKSRLKWAAKDKEAATRLRERLAAARANIVMLLHVHDTLV